MDFAKSFSVFNSVPAFASKSLSMLTPAPRPTDATTLTRTSRLGEAPGLRRPPAQAGACRRRCRRCRALSLSPPALVRL